MENCFHCDKAKEDHPAHQFDLLRTRIGVQGTFLAVMCSSVLWALTTMVYKETWPPGIALLAACLTLGSLVILALFSAGLWGFYPEVSYFFREKVQGYYLYHFVTEAGEYHHHAIDPREYRGTPRFHILCRIAHGGWRKENTILDSTSGDTRPYWQVEWASPLIGPDHKCWIRIQSTQNKYGWDVPWPSSITVPIEQAFEIMTKYGSVHKFVEKSFGVMWYEKPGLENSLDRLRRELDSEERRVSAMAKSVIRMLATFEHMKNTVGRTKHAQAIKSPLEDMLKLVGDDDLVNELKTEVMNEHLDQSSPAPPPTP